MSKLKLLTTTIFLMAAILLMIAALDQFVQLSSPSASPTSPTRQVVSPSKQIVASTLPLQEIWRWSGTILSHDTPNLAINDHRLILATIDRQVPMIAVLDADTGQIIWKGRYTLSEAPNNFWSANADQDRVYVGSGNYVEAFEMETGNLLWRGGEIHSGWHGTRNIYPRADKIDVYHYTDDHLVYSLDKQTEVPPIS